MYQLSPDMKHNCKYCQNHCIKNGVQNSIQKFLCKICNKYQQHTYLYKRLDTETKQNIVNLTQEGVGMSSISRLVKTSRSTVQRSIYRIGSTIRKPIYNEFRQEYELDEMTLTIAGMKDIYLIYAINRQTRNVIDFIIGNRTKLNIKKVVDSVLNYQPKIIFKDGLNSYPSLIPKYIHRPGRRLTNRIERKNLTIKKFC